MATYAANLPEVCQLLGVKQVVKVRTIGEGRDKKFSLIDVAMLVSGKASRHAAEDVKKVRQEYSELADFIGQFKFPGAGRHETPIADLRTTLLVVLRLRSKVAQRLSAKVIDVFVRYVGGDPELAKEVLDNKEFQEQLAVEQQPEHPARFFGHAAASRPKRSHLTTNPDDAPIGSIDEPPQLQFKTHAAPVDLVPLSVERDLYLILVIEYRNGAFISWFWKIGRSDEPSRRAAQLPGEVLNDRGNDWRHILIDIFHGCGVIESSMKAVFSSQLIEGTTEYFKAPSDFREKVYAAVQDQVIRKIEVQQLTQRKALETLGRADAVEDRDAKRRRLQMELQVEQAITDAKIAEIKHTQQQAEQQAERLAQLQFQEAQQLSALRLEDARLRMAAERAALLPPPSPIVTTQQRHTVAANTSTATAAVRGVYDDAPSYVENNDNNTPSVDPVVPPPVWPYAGSWVCKMSKREYQNNYARFRRHLNRFEQAKRDGKSLEWLNNDIRVLALIINQTAADEEKAAAEMDVR